MFILVKFTFSTLQSPLFYFLITFTLQVNMCIWVKYFYLELNTPFDNDRETLGLRVRGDSDPSTYQSSTPNEMDRVHPNVVLETYPVTLFEKAEHKQGIHSP